VIVWLDAQLSPALARWISETFNVDASPVRDHGLQQAADATIFAAARKASAVVMTKDRDFVSLQARLGPPPHVIWITCATLRMPG
jgi:predicted nuclease of predicted toxin-antitoxin system